MASTSNGRLDPYAALIVAAEGNVYRALSQLKEAYRHYPTMAHTMMLNERRIFIGESDIFVSSSEVRAFGPTLDATT